MKKLFALFLVCAMYLSIFAGCTTNETPVETGAPAPTEETKDYSQYASGIVPVGPYNYPPAKYSFSPGEAPSS